MIKQLTRLAYFSLLLVWLAVFGGNAQASMTEDVSNWRFFTLIHADLRSDLDPESNQDASNTSAAAGVIYQQKFNRLNLLGESFAANDTVDVNRLKLGWDLSDQLLMWVGRFYTPIGYWNVHYNHGSFDSLSVHRPSIMEYEDQGGVLPMHTTGALFVGRLLLADHKIGYQLAFGGGPELDENGKLKPIDILNPGATEYKRSVTARLYMKQAGSSPMEAGLFVNSTNIPSSFAGVTEIEQKTFGGFYYANWTPIETLWTLYTVTNDVTQSGVNQQGSFSGGYVRVGYTINHLWTVYMSIEDIQRANNDPYLSLFPNFVIARNLVGLRINFRKNQTLSIEMLDSKLFQGSHVHTSVQWSAMFN